MNYKAQVGAQGEAVAAQWLHDNGFEILHTNWRAGRYEIDIVAFRDDVVHFIEVKTRQKGGLTAPEDAITPAKFSALKHAAAAYLSLHAIDCEVQFDAIAVEYGDTKCRVRYIANAMVPTWRTF